MIRNGIHTSARYLLIPELELFTSPTIVEFLKNYNYTEELTNLTYIQDHYSQMLSKAINYNYVSYIDYILTYIPSNPEIDNQVFFNFILRDELIGVQKLIEYKRVDPMRISI